MVRRAGSNRQCAQRSNRRTCALGLITWVAALTVPAVGYAQASDASTAPVEHFDEVCVAASGVLFGNEAAPTSVNVVLDDSFPDVPLVVVNRQVKVELSDAYASREPQPLPEWRFAGEVEWVPFSGDISFPCTPEGEGDCPDGFRSRLTGDVYGYEQVEARSFQVELADPANTFAGVRVRMVCLQLVYYLASEAPERPDAGPPVQLPDFEPPAPAADAGTPAPDGSLNAPPPEQRDGADAGAAQPAQGSDRDESGCSAIGGPASRSLGGLFLLGLVSLARRRRPRAL